jgi:hypothetical protein|tara:strand:+ start:274 stop:462 length:189 start_codon:yes stop_codon:yes gene_type:complete
MKDAVNEFFCDEPIYSSFLAPKFNFSNDLRMVLLAFAEELFGLVIGFFSLSLFVKLLKKEVP